MKCNIKNNTKTEAFSSTVSLGSSINLNQELQKSTDLVLGKLRIMLYKKFLSHTCYKETVFITAFWYH